MSDTAAGYRGGGGLKFFFQSNSIRNTSGMAVMVAIGSLMVGVVEVNSI